MVPQHLSGTKRHLIGEPVGQRAGAAGRGHNDITRARDMLGATAVAPTVTAVLSAVV
jgi:hypothetical protein